MLKMPKKKSYFNFLITFLLAVVFIAPYAKYGIYPDEIAEQIWGTRFFQDFPFRVSVTPQCLENFIVRIPAALYPPAFILGFISFINDIVLFRLFTLILVGLIFFLTYKNLKLHYTKLNPAFFICLIFIAFSGPKLIGLTIFRPELILTLTLLYGCFLTLKKNPISIEYLLLGLLYSCALYLHPFSIYFFPAIILITFKNKLLSLYIFLATYFSYQIWQKQLFECSLKELVHINKSFNISPLDFIYTPRIAFQNLLDRFSFSQASIIFKRITFQSDYATQIGYMPNFNLDNIFLGGINFFVKLVFLYSILLCFYQTFKYLRLFFRTFKADINAYLAFLFICTFIHLILNKTNAFYAVSFWYFIFVFIAIFWSVEIFKTSLIGVKILPKIFYGIFFFALISQFIFFGKIRHFLGPNLPLRSSYYYTADYRNQVREAFLRCCNKENGKKIQIDDASYFILKRDLINPVPLTYVGAVGNYKDFLKNQKITFSIARCGYNAMMFSKDPGFEIDGGFGVNNICIKQINFSE